MNEDALPEETPPEPGNDFFKSLGKFALQQLGGASTRPKRAIAIGVILLIFATVWYTVFGRIAGSNDDLARWPAFGMGFLALALVAAGLLSWLVASDPERGPANEPESSPAPATRSRLGTDSTNIQVREQRAPGILIGVRFGRRSVTCGCVVLAESSFNGIPSSSAYKRLQQTETRQFDVNAKASEQFAAAAAAICSMVQIARVNEPMLPILGIGIGAPGLVKLHERTIRMMTRGRWDLAHLVEGIVANLVSDANFGAAFGSSDVPSITSQTFLDNDVRCATRSMLSQHVDDENWGNFAAIHVGTGVGVGIVLDGHIYYGPRGWAGELGHVDLTVGEQVAVGGAHVPRLECSCGTKGHHFEALVNYTGLKRLAEMIGSQFPHPDGYTQFDEIRAAFASAGSTWTEERILREGWPMLVGSTISGQIPPDMIDLWDLARRVECETYLQMVLRVYTALLAGGVSTIVNLFDIEKVVFFGSLYETLTEQPRFHPVLADHIARLRLPFERVIEFDQRSVAEDGWLGAALMVVDDDFHRARERSSRVAGF
jgi:predicted NBD/HSP70 family sugar kinase